MNTGMRNLTFRWKPVEGSMPQSFSWEGAQLIQKAMKEAFGEEPWRLNQFDSRTLRAIYSLLDDQDKVEFQPIIAATFNIGTYIDLWFSGD